MALINRNPLMLKQRAFNVGWNPAQINAPHRGKLWGGGGIVELEPFAWFNENSLDFQDGQVTRWRNAGPGGAVFDLDTIFGTKENLTYLESGRARTSSSAGVRFTTSDTALNQVTGSIEVEWTGALDNWNVDDQVLISKALPGGNLCFIFQANIGVDTFSLFLSVDGNASVPTTSPIAGMLNGIEDKISARFDAGAQTTEYFKNDISLGAPQAAGVGSLFASSADIEICGYANGNFDTYDGVCRGARLYDGLKDSGGTLASEFQPSLAPGPISSWQSSIGESWSAQNGAHVNSTSYPVANATGGVGLGTTLGQLLAGNVGTVFLVGRKNGSAPSADEYFFDSRGDAGNRWSLRSDDSNSDAFTMNQGSDIVVPGSYNRDISVFTMQLNGDGTSTLTISGEGTITGNAGAQGLEFLNLFMDVSGANQLNGWIGEMIFFERALTVDEVSQVQDFLEAKWL